MKKWPQSQRGIYWGFEKLGLDVPFGLRNDYWLLAQWGQLIFVILGFAFAAGGTIISWIGITHVFVQTDLAYLQLTPGQMTQFNNKIIQLIAHDRAGLVLLFPYLMTAKQSSQDKAIK